jgi:hypothetical protein
MRSRHLVKMDGTFQHSFSHGLFPRRLGQAQVALFLSVTVVLALANHVLIPQRHAYTRSFPFRADPVDSPGAYFPGGIRCSPQADSSGEPHVSQG